jgi:ribose transport system ATP-binding protein
MSAISKRFPGVVALADVDFEVHRGEIVALVGENGAGKSTLMKVLAGIHRADAGTMQVDGVPALIQTPSDAASLGIAVIHQALELVDTLDVAGNIFLGRELHRGPLRLLDRRQMEVDADQQLARVGLPVSPRTPLRRLSPAQRQLVAIARALSMNARLLVLDEPTSSLGAVEAERLFAVLEDLRAGGAGIVYISHRLQEIERLADRAVVLRDGRHAGSLARREMSHDRLVRLMVGRAVNRLGHDGLRRPNADGTSGASGLHLDGIRTTRYPGAEVSLTVRRGEVLGIAGLVGAGRSELAETICGIVPRLGGRIALDDRVLTITSPRDAIRQGLCLVPEDRRRHGVIDALSVRENITLPALDSYARVGLVRRRVEAGAARETAAALTVKATSIETRVATLSGGNQQKVVLGKWMALRPQVIVFDEPTQGVDVGAKADIHQLIRRLADGGAVVMMISSDLEEIVAASDRVAVMHDGRITGVLDRASCTPEAIMTLAVASHR